ncbi:pentatricopeptide repeat domain-containing [Fusarium albosuccineum]|uniref:Pentatricopeptide repeat domain-containing n=1 Tax=Fusarium albosuccineum TaxID=1237068 RepID=A0A8H4L317_9HYPO|nr:pentatricopeptide repeat domain-containing [Fusarium albosuccineum]
MYRTLSRTRRFPAATTRVHSGWSYRSLTITGQVRSRCLAIAPPLGTGGFSRSCTCSQAAESVATQKRWSSIASKEPRSGSEARVSEKSEATPSTPLGIRLRDGGGFESSVQNPALDEVSIWERRIVTTRHGHGDQGAWDIFLELRKNGAVHLVTEPWADFLRDNILRAALTNADHMEELFDFAQQLRDQYEFEWPELYMKVVHFYLGQVDYDTAFLWHLKLMPIFRPDLDSFGALLTSFVIDFSPKIQSTLTRMYVFNPYRDLYDYVVPALFDSGQSHPARVWRKRFMLFNDHAKSSKSKPFLDFLSRYFSKVQLTQEELRVLGQNLGAEGDLEEPMPRDPQSDQPKGIYSDKFTARWFASSWTSAEFAINLMHKLGLRVIGPRSLQSVALREDDARGVTDRLAQLQKLGIAISPTLYCKALVAFARRGEDELLRDLLHCDIHPDEFEDPETRQMLLAASARQQDWSREQLLQEVEGLEASTSASQTRSLSEQLNQHLSTALSKNGLAKVRTVLDKMESLNVSMEQKNSAGLLHRIFQDIWYHPKSSKQGVHGYQEDPQLDRAIHLALRVARHDVAVPIRYWQMLLYNLGRLGRFNELEALSYEICELYSPDLGGLIPVHWRDMPPKPGANSKKTAEPETPSWPNYFSEVEGKEKQNHFAEEFWRAEMGFAEEQAEDVSKKSKSSKKPRDNSQKRHGKAEYVFCIPADLPFTNRQHPVQKIFDISLQRAILRWGFDKTLAQEPTKPSLMKVKQAGVQDFDLACGVRLLALLRDRGVYIDKQVIRSAMIKRIAVAHLPGRARARARDDRELSPANMKRLIDEAWGSEILPSEAQLTTEINNQKPKLWKNYSRLFKKTYDKDGSDN